MGQTSLHNWLEVCSQGRRTEDNSQISVSGPWQISMHDGEVQREKLVCDGNLGHVEFEMTQCTLMESFSVSMVLKVCTRVKD